MSQIEIPRPEHPKPQFQRVSWQNLNGQWTYILDPGKSGMARDLNGSKGFDNEITVPFCPESELSGVAHTDFIEAMWYHRKIDIPKDWARQRIVMHFGGVDYESELFIDGRAAGIHFGGTVSFSHDITSLVEPGSTHNLVLRVLDETRDAGQPRGKQSGEYEAYACLYTRTTGIWQTVWMEAMNPSATKNVQILPNLDAGTLTVVPRFYEITSGMQFRVSVMADGNVITQETTAACEGAPVTLTIPEPRAWSPEDPHLYDVLLETLDETGTVLDSVNSYVGLRKIHSEGNKFFLNNKPLYQRLVLDQGFYPGGIWTAPSDEALKSDIELSMAAGFNGARLHQKVFEERFHYWADKLGYLTWGETASWGCDQNEYRSQRNFLTEWREIIVRDRNHPSIIAWTPWNETWKITIPKEHHRAHSDAYYLAHDLDPTRPVNDASGYIHVITDLWTVHRYQQDPQKLTEELTPTEENGVHRDQPDKECEYRGQPYLVDEFGGIKWVPGDLVTDNEHKKSWGYGKTPQSLEEFYARLEGLVDAILDQEHICGYCYTQLTDVEQEQNGLYNYDRTTKFDMEKVARIFRKSPQT